MLFKIETWIDNYIISYKIDIDSNTATVLVLDNDNIFNVVEFLANIRSVDCSQHFLDNIRNVDKILSVDCSQYFLDNIRNVEKLDKILSVDCSQYFFRQN